jgi:hypothetical protein
VLIVRSFLLGLANLESSGFGRSRREGRCIMMEGGADAAAVMLTVL